MVAVAPQYDRTNVLVGQVRTFVAPYNAVVPVALPAESVALGGTWAAPWVPIGATEKGVSLLFKRETEDVTIEEQLTPVQKNTKSVDLRVNTVLSEDTLQTMKLAFGGGTITVTAPGAGQIGKETLVISSDLDQLVVGMEGVNKYGFFRRVLIPLVTSEADVETEFVRSSNARRYKTSLVALCAPEEVVIINKTANATS
jgi:hypothetical protein